MEQSGKGIKKIIFIILCISECAYNKPGRKVRVKKYLSEESTMCNNLYYFASILCMRYGKRKRHEKQEH